MRYIVRQAYGNGNNPVGDQAYRNGNNEIDGPISTYAGSQPQNSDMNSLISQIFATMYL